MNAVLLCFLVLLVALCGAVLVGQRRLARRVDARAESRAQSAEAAASASAAAVPQQAIREAVRQALAEDRAQELAEARAFWAEQEAREAREAQQFDEELDPQFAETLRTALAEADRVESELAGLSGPAAGIDPRRHPSHPDFVPSPTPSHEWTDMRLTELAELAIPLADLRPGPLGTLDVYAFADDTHLCVAPGCPETAARVKSALEAGTPVWLLGQERFSGGHALTFAIGEESATAFVLADRVIASV